MWKKTQDNIWNIPKDLRPLVLCMYGKPYSEWLVGHAVKVDDGKLQWLIDGKAYSAFEVEYWLDPSATDVHSKEG